MRTLREPRTAVKRRSPGTRSSLSWRWAFSAATAFLRRLKRNPPEPQQLDQPPTLNPDSFLGKEPTEGVYVRDSAG